MNATSWLLLAAAAVVAVANWWSRANDDKRLEYVTKPTVTMLIALSAVALDPAHDEMRAWFVAGFVLCLVGDVALMLPAGSLRRRARRLPASPTSCSSSGFLVAGDVEWLSLALGAVVVLAGAVMVGRAIVAGAARAARRGCACRWRALHGW